MLQRDLQVLRACQHQIVAEEELLDSVDNILNVTTACRFRKVILRGEKLFPLNYTPLYASNMLLRDVCAPKFES